MTQVMAATVTEVPGVTGDEVPADGAAVLEGAADALKVPEGWSIVPAAPPSVPIYLSVIPFIDDVKDKFTDKDPSDMSVENVLNRSVIDTVKNLIGEDKMSEMIDDAACVGRMNMLIEKCFCWGSCLPITCAPCFCCVHSMTQSKPQALFEKWQNHMRTVPKVSADYKFELFFRPGNVWASLFTQNVLPYQFFFGFGFRPTDEAASRILAEEATRKAKEALGFKSEEAKEENEAGNEVDTDIENKEEEDYWLFSVLGFGSSKPAAESEETSAVVAPDSAKKTEQDATVDENDDSNHHITNNGTNTNNDPVNDLKSQCQQDSTIDNADVNDVNRTQEDGAQTASAEPAKKKSWFGRNKDKKGKNKEVKNTDTLPTVVDTSASSQENVTSTKNVDTNHPLAGAKSNDNDDYKIPPPKEHPVEVKEEAKPTPQFDCGCT